MQNLGSFSEDAKPRSDRNQRLLAAFLSMVVPGAGQFYRRRMVAGATFLAVYIDLWLGFAWFRWPRYYAGYVILMLLMMSIPLVAGLNAAYGKGSSKTRLSGWWALPLMVAGILALAPQLRLSFRLSGFLPLRAQFTGMEPAIQRDDQLIVDLRSYDSHDPVAGDVVVFKRNNTYFLKRVIAVGGQEVAGKDGNISVNGQILVEAYAHSTPKAAKKAATAKNDEESDDDDDDSDNGSADFGPVKVPAGKLFVAGDNRDLSFDSRWPSYGYVDVRDVIGKPLYVYRGANPGREGVKIY